MKCLLIHVQNLANTSQECVISKHFTFMGGVGSDRLCAICILGSIKATNVGQEIAGK